MTEHVPASRRRPVEGVGVVHAGFGRYYRTDADGNRIGEAMTKAEAGATGLPMQKAPTQAAPAPSAPPKRRRRASVGGAAKRLDAPVRPGFVRRFFNDVGNRLATAFELGYEFVEQPGVQTSDPGSRINRLAGTQPNGAPLKTYLMETPDELYAEGVAEKEAHNRQIDDAIRAGVDSTGQLGPKSETYGQGSIEQDR